MVPFLPFSIRNSVFLLTSDKTLYWESESVLILSDLHLAKTGHFRKSGIPIPGAANLDTMHRLLNQIQYFKPKTVLLTGDLFHSHSNKEVDQFIHWRQHLSGTQFELIPGNHDIIDPALYREAGIRIQNNHITKGEFTFIHNRYEYTEKTDKYIISGHIHPGIRIQGMGKQALTLPCFHFTEQEGILPAFGAFTGKHLISPRKNDAVFVVGNRHIFRMQ